MIHSLLEARLAEALPQVLPDAAGASVLVRLCSDARFGDFQTDGLIKLAEAGK